MNQLLSLLMLLALPAALYGGALLVGLGRCMDCRRHIAPWEARCVPCEGKLTGRR